MGPGPGLYSFVTRSGLCSVGRSSPFCDPVCSGFSGIPSGSCAAATFSLGTCVVRSIRVFALSDVQTYLPYRSRQLQHEPVLEDLTETIVSKVSAVDPNILTSSIDPRNRSSNRPVFVEGISATLAGSVWRLSSGGFGCAICSRTQRPCASRMSLAVLLPLVRVSSRERSVR